LDRIAPIGAVGYAATGSSRREESVAVPVPATVVSASIIAPPTRDAHGTAQLLAQLLAHEGSGDRPAEVDLRIAAGRYAAATGARRRASISVRAWSSPSAVARGCSPNGLGTSSWPRVPDLAARPAPGPKLSRRASAGSPA
jgi:hypothetical protein